MFLKLLHALLSNLSYFIDVFFVAFLFVNATQLRVIGPIYFLKNAITSEVENNENFNLH